LLIINKKFGKFTKANHQFSHYQKHLLKEIYILQFCWTQRKEGCIPEDWKSSVVLPIYKGKGNPMECGSYRGNKLLEHAMKVVERIFTMPASPPLSFYRPDALPATQPTKPKH